MTRDRYKQRFWETAFCAALASQEPPLVTYDVKLAAEIADVSLLQWEARWSGLKSQGSDIKYHDIDSIARSLVRIAGDHENAGTLPDIAHSLQFLVLTDRRKEP